MRNTVEISAFFSLVEIAVRDTDTGDRASVMVSVQDAGHVIADLKRAIAAARKTSELVSSPTPGCGEPTQEDTP